MPIVLIRNIFTVYMTNATHRKHVVASCGRKDSKKFRIPSKNQSMCLRLPGTVVILKKAVSDRLGAPSGARTLDPNIKSVVLYQLS